MANGNIKTPNVIRAIPFAFPCGLVLLVEPANMSNKKHKDVEHEESGSEDEQDSGSERDSDFDSDGNFVGDKVCDLTSKHMAYQQKQRYNFSIISFKINCRAVY